jgi:poly(A) polymerase
MTASTRSADPLRQTAQRLVAHLQSSGHRAFFAGGCVRDMLRGELPKDYDVATDATPEQVQALFRRTVPVGARFGVIRVLENGFEFEVATFRSDHAYLDGRRPVGVTFATPEEDAARRDFTINGVFFDPVAEEVIDYVGGQDDLRSGVVRAIGDPKARFAEDRLRLLRGIRLAARFGFEIDDPTWTALVEAAAKIVKVSPERIRDELVKILVDPNRLRGFDLLDASGLLMVILPEVAALKGCEQPAQFHPEGDVFVHTRLMLSLLAPETDALLALSVLLHDIGKPVTRQIDPVSGRIRFNGHDRVGAEMAEAVMNRLRFSRHETATVVEAVRQHMVFKDVQQMRSSRLRRFMARPHFNLELELHRVDCAGSHGDLTNVEFLREKAEEFAREPLIPAPLVSGRDLIELGLQPGPAFGPLLEAVQTAQLEGEVRTRAEALKLLARLAASAGL